jgi:hypothetical protein
MNQKPTRSSVTSEPCGCGYLQRACDEPTVPIVFDEEMGEFQIEHPRGGGYSVLYHCPWCGGAAPRSKRSRRFATISTEEATRLRSLTAELTSVDAAIIALGSPDVDDPIGTSVSTVGSGNEPPRVTSYRMLTFRGLSDCADVILIDYGPKGVAFTFQGKYLGTAKSASAQSGT